MLTSTMRNYVNLSNILHVKKWFVKFILHCNEDVEEFHKIPLDILREYV